MAQPQFHDCSRLPCSWEEIPGGQWPCGSRGQVVGSESDRRLKLWPVLHVSVYHPSLLRPLKPGHSYGWHIL